MNMTDLTTNYLGLGLKNPFLASSSPLTQRVESALRLEEAGAAALVLPSLFEEQVIYESLRLDRDLMRGAESFAEALDYLPGFGQYSVGPGTYLENLSKIKQAVSIPVLGSLNGVTPGGWADYARRIEQAGADALELNLYDVATDFEITSQDLEDRHVRLVREVRAQVTIPIAVKLSPFYSSLPNFARRLVQAGADGLVLFNRFYQPDFDLEALEVIPNLVLSHSSEMRLPLRWVAILHGKLKVDLGLTGGVHTASDLIKAVMAGAGAVLVASELLQHGPQRISEILAEVEAWMDEHEYVSINQMQGSMSQLSIGDPAAFERANYMRVLSSY
jgi:dihydroorotate dehydrogenase (fumarate)